MATVTPHLLVQRHLDTVLAELPRAFDGDVEGVHQARIATRRLREVLPYLFPSASRKPKSNPDRIVKAVRNLGRHLGRVRELDVMESVLNRAGERMASTASVVAAAQGALRKRQRSERRDMVKAIERLKPDRLQDVLRKHHHSWSGTPFRLLRRSRWVDVMWARIATRAAEAAEAVRRAPAIYFPNRAHEARIAIKKLRYAVEVGLDTGVWPAERLLKDLRRVQGTLGDLHDAQVAVDGLDDLLGDAAASTDAVTLKALLEDDIARAHAEYARRRERILMIAEVCVRAAARAAAAGRQRRTLVAASLLTAPLLLGAGHSSSK